MEEYLGGKQASKILGVHQRTLMNWDRKGLIETKRTPGNKRLYNVKKFIGKNNYNFSIPKTNIHAINLTYLFDKYVKAYNDEEDNSTKKIIGMMQGSFKALSDCGLKLDNMKKLSLFSNKMLEVFSSSQISIHTQPGHSDYINLIDKKNVHKIVSGPVIHKFMVDNSRKNKKITISENILNIGAHMFRQGWFDIIDNKRILIISKHYNLIKKQIEKEEGNENKYYKRSIFKNCSYEYMDIPELQDSDDDFVSVVNRYIKEFGEKIQKKSYDIVFIGNLNYVPNINAATYIAKQVVPSLKKSKSNLAITGLYFFDNKVIKFAKTLKPSKRNEVEIVDLLNKYNKNNQLKYELLGRGGAWLDTGSIKNFLNTSNFIASIEERQGFKIGCIEEIAYKNKWRK